LDAHRGHGPIRIKIKIKRGRFMEGRVGGRRGQGSCREAARRERFVRRIPAS
jgi:hypothetical protein